LDNWFGIDRENTNLDIIEAPHFLGVLISAIAKNGDLKQPQIVEKPYIPSAIHKKTESNH